MSNLEQNSNYYRWVGYWKAHKIGIRRGNFDLQIACLAAFAPLFPITGKFRYAESVTIYLGKLHQDPEFCKRLHQVPSINLTREGHYLGYDEALETYGVHFIKQAMTGKLGGGENLHRQIQGSQDEMDRLKLLDEFINDKTINYGDHTSRDYCQEMWALSDQVYDAFQNPNEIPSF